METFDSMEQLEHRLGKRDDIIAILPEGDAHYILTQGNEPEWIVDMVRLLKTFQDTDSVHTALQEAAGGGSHAFHFGARWYAD